MDKPKILQVLRLLLVPLACLPLLLLFFYPEVGKWTVFLGRFHPVVLHLPIGILLLTALMEALQVVSRGRWKFSIQLPLFLGATTAVAAMTLGILLMSGEKMEGPLIDSHFNWGIATAVFAVLALLFRNLPEYEVNKMIPRFYRGSLFATCGIMGWASHQGASITHGETYLLDHIPWLADEVSEEDVLFAQQLSLPPEERDVYEHVVVPIFRSKCYDCHKSRSFKGGLVMDTYAGLLEGGATRSSIVPGDVSKSLALERVYLPLADEEHMPPAGDPQMTAEEIRVIEWWVENQAPASGTLSSLEPEEEILTAIEAVSQELLAELDSGMLEEDDHHHELSAEEVAELRASLASEVAQLRREFPGAIRYRYAQSGELIVKSFNRPWKDEDLQKLKPIAGAISELVIPRSEITSQSLEVLNEMTRLEVLDLRSASVDDQLVMGLKLPAIKRFNLFETEVTDESARSLAGLKTLRHLFLGGTQMSKTGLKTLREDLPDASIIGGGVN